MAGLKDSLLRSIGKRLPSSVDILESEDELLILVNIAGFDQGDMKVRFVDSKIEISAERDDTYNGYESVLESRPRKVSETVPLPRDADIDAEGADTAYVDGVLRIRLPKVDMRAAREETEEPAPADDGAEETETEDEEEGEEDEETVEVPASADELGDMDYRDLQKVAKELDIKANQSREDLIDEISDEITGGAEEEAVEKEEETEDDDLPSSREELEEMGYRDLQGVAKELDIKANQSTEDLIDEISDELDL